MFSGSMVALVTPMLADGSIDIPALKRLVHWHCESGTKALVVLGTTGEASSLSYEERQVVLEAVITENAGRLPVIVGTGTNNLQVSIKYSQQAKLLGVDALLVVTPYYVKPTQDALVKYYTSLTSQVNMPTILYNVPSRTGCDLSVQTVQQLAQLDQVIGIKDATGQLSRVSEMRQFKQDFAVYSGDDATAAEAISAGARGVITVIGNLLPTQTAQLCASAAAQDASVLSAVEQEIAPVLKQLSMLPNPVGIKWMMSQMGLISDGIRLPLIELASQYHSDTKHAMHAAGLLN